jgi:chemotaxis protein CheD
LKNCSLKKGVRYMHLIDKLYLYPGQSVVTKEVMEISTILGSCVSVCLFDSIRGIAGMNHFLMPVNDKFGSDIEKYGDTSMEFILDKMLRMGSNQRDIVAKVFGGGELLTYKNSSFNIGKKNIEAALNFICDREIRVVSKAVGGKRGRKIIFNTLTGIVRQTYIASSQLPPGQ